MKLDVVEFMCMERVKNYVGLKRGSVIQYVGRIVLCFINFRVFLHLILRFLRINCNISIFYFFVSVIFFYRFSENVNFW